MLIKSGSVLMAIGSILFLTGAFAPISNVYITPAAADRLQLIQDAPVAWITTQGLFAAGSILFAIGVLVAGIVFRVRSGNILLLIAGIIFLVGALVWTWNVYLRAIDPEAFTQNILPRWPGILYSVLTQVGFALAGISFLRLEYSRWAGWVLISGAVILFVMFLITGDVPPLLYYLLGLAIPVALFSAG